MHNITHNYFVASIDVSCKNRSGTMMPIKSSSRILPLLAVAACISGGRLVESRVLQVSSVVCLTAEQCEEKFNSLNWDGYFYADDNFPTKGCFSKNNNGNLYFGSGGSVAEMSEANVPGSRERVWCDVQTDVPTPSPIQKQVEWVIETTAPPVTDNPSKQPTLKPVTDSPTEQPSPLPSNTPSSKPTMQPTTEPTVSIV